MRSRSEGGGLDVGDKSGKDTLMAVGALDL